jgi:hypothetical protein
VTGDFVQSIKEFVVGDQKIVNFYSKFPQTQHDFTSFCIDVPQATNEKVLITVCGYLKVMGNRLNDESLVYAFTRNFVLKNVGEKSFCGVKNKTFKFVISNEQFNIRKVSPIEASKIFKKFVVTEEEMKEICKDLLPKKSECEEASILLFKSWTSLKKVWCERLLQDANWDVKVALGFFKEFVDREILQLKDFQLEF